MPGRRKKKKEASRDDGIKLSDRRKEERRKLPKHEGTL